MTVKVKVGFLCSAAYTTTGPTRCTVLKVAADRQELMVLQHSMRPSIASQTDNWTHDAASKHTTALTSHTRLSLRKHSPDGATPTEVADIWLQLTTHLLTPKGWKAELAWLVYPHKWSPISCRSSAGQQKFAGQRRAFYRCATPPTTLCHVLLWFR